ncbi:ANTAR domain-containing protein [Euzebya sp.]|uniref:ANTAR domain-containing protein n=1 Tax=Euzebya sp. TaxID=1971409 RepID=UPI003518A802
MDPRENRDRELLQLLVRFATTVVTDYTAEAALDRLVAQVPELLEVDGAGIMLEDDAGELRFVSASDDMVRLIEEYQIQTGQGPCVSAYVAGEHVAIDDLADETPFPDFADVAINGGLRAVHSFPMLLGGRRVGALNLYREKPGPLPEDGIELGQLFADVATAYLFSARAQGRLTSQIEGLRQAIAENGAVDQAKGVLMHTFDLDDREAFGALRRFARANRRRVLDVAQDVMSGTLVPSDIIPG